MTDVVGEGWEEDGGFRRNSEGAVWVCWVLGKGEGVGRFG